MYKTKDTYWGYGYPLGGEHSKHWKMHRHENSDGHHYAKSVTMSARYGKLTDPVGYTAKEVLIPWIRTKANG